MNLTTMKLTTKNQMGVLPIVADRGPLVDGLRPRRVIKAHPLRTPHVGAVSAPVEAVASKAPGHLARSWGLC